MCAIALDQTTTTDPWRGWIGASGPAGLIAALTVREREILELMSQGRSNAAMCSELYLSPKTIEAHVRSIFWKLRLSPCGTTHRRVTAVLVYLDALRQLAAHRIP